MTSFADLGLRPEVVDTVIALKYGEPTDVQAAAIPAMLAGHDVIAQAHTGTGKTAAFALPMLSRLDPDEKGVQGLVVVPTRELATQVARAFTRYGRGLDAHALAVYGGQSYSWQAKRLDQGVAFVVCTPGRALDLIKRGTLKLDKVRSVALDEADEMLRMGFIDDVDTLLAATPASRQTALFSATMPGPVRRLAERYMRDAVTINVRDEAMTVENVTQRFYLLEEMSKVAALARLLEVENVERGLVFVRTRVGCAMLADTLGARGFSAEAIHGDLPQDARESVLARFRAGRIRLLVATDVAARGLDIPAVSHVFNYDFPDQPQDYVHRIGRTARAGSEGTALSLVTPRERPRLVEVGYYTRRPPTRAIVPTVAEVHAHRDARFAAGVDQIAVEEDLKAALRWVDEQAASGKDLRTLAAALVKIARHGEMTRPDEEVREVFPKVHRQPEVRNDRGPRAKGPNPYLKPMAGAKPFKRGDAEARDKAGKPFKPRDEGAGKPYKARGEKPFKPRDEAGTTSPAGDAESAAKPHKRERGLAAGDVAGEFAGKPPKSGFTPSEEAKPYKRGKEPVDDAPTRGAVTRKAGRAGREPGMVRFAIPMGSAQGVRAADVVATIARNASVPGSALGAIKIGRSRTTVDVAEKFAMQVLRKLQGGFMLRGQQVQFDQE